MTVCVIATICKESGALSIYRQFLSYLKEKKSSGDCFYIIIDPQMPAPEIDGVCYVRYSTRGFRRIIFDAWGFKKVCQKEGIIPDVIFSLNNTGVNFKGIRQIIYYHQALPLYPNCFSPFKKEERSLWFLDLYYPIFVKRSLQENTDVVVQTEFIRHLFSKKYRFPEERIYVAFPDVQQIIISQVDGYQYEKNTVNFLYPAIASAYKEHLSLVKMLDCLHNNDIKDKVRIHLTLKNGENPVLEKSIEASDLKKHFVFHGAIPYARLLSMYKSADGLLFPSTIETIGLPLLEAAAFGLPVVTNDLDYTKEVLNGYEGHIMVPLWNSQAWADAVVGLCREKKRFPEYKRQQKSDWNKVLNLIVNKRFE